MADDLIDKVVAARKAAIAENTHPESPVRSEAQNAAILAAQVKEIMNYYSSEDVLLARIEALESQVKNILLAPSAPPPSPAAPVLAAAAPDEPEDEEVGEGHAEPIENEANDAQLVLPEGDLPAEDESEEDQ